MNEAGAAPGDVVVVAVASGAVLRAGLLVYALPVAGLVLLAAAAQLAARVLAPAAADQAAGAGGILGALLGALAARRIARRRGASLPVVRIVRISSRVS